MLRLGTCGLVIGALVMTDALYVQGQPPPRVVRNIGRDLPPPVASPSTGQPWYKRILSKEEPPPAPPTTVSAPKVSPKEASANTLESEQQAHLRRLAHCTRLKEIAADTSDEVLMNEALDLEQMSIDLYNRKIAHLPGVRVPRYSAEKKLDAKLGTGIATDPLESDAKKTNPSIGNASAKRGGKP